MGAFDAILKPSSAKTQMTRGVAYIRGWTLPTAEFITYTNSHTTGITVIENIEYLIRNSILENKIEFN